MKKERHRYAAWSDMEQDPLFALPVAATAILEQLFNASDLAVVGNLPGRRTGGSRAAVGGNSSVVSLVVNLFTGVALGARTSL